jgi:hypothetical protein
MTKIYYWSVAMFIELPFTCLIKIKEKAFISPIISLYSIVSYNYMYFFIGYFMGYCHRRGRAR